jgi:hypothetical protein
MTVFEKKAAFERTPPAVRESTLLRFSGVDGFDVYNCSTPFMFRGRRHIFGRVEARDRWADSRVALFVETAPDAYERVREFDMLQLEDPFVTIVGDEFVLGGTHPQKIAGDVSTYFAYFYRGTDPLHLSYFTTGPVYMKDIRLAPLATGRIGVFSRPRGEDVRAKYGSAAIVGYTEISSLDELTPEVVQGARFVPGLFAKDEWGGCNQCHPLADGRIGVAAHLCCNGPAGADGKALAIYCNAAFVFDPATHTASDPWIVATRSLHAPGPAKLPYLADCAFTSGFDFRPDGLVDVYSGLGDAAEGRVALPAARFWTPR